MTFESQIVDEEEEVVGEPISTSRALRRAFVEAPTLRRGLFATLGLSVLGTIGQLVVPVVVQQITDRELLNEAGPRIPVVLWQGGVAVAVLILTATFTRAAVFRLTRLTAGGLRELRVKLFSHLHRLSILHVQAERRGALVSRVTSDIYTIQDFMEWGGVGMLIGSAQVLLALAVMFFYRWQLALLVLVGIIVYIWMLLFFQQVLQRAQDQVREKVADSLSVIGETITGLPIIRSHGVEETAVAKVHNFLQVQVAAEHRANRLSAILFSSAELFAAGITAMVIGAGILLGAAEGTSAGVLLAFLFLVNLMIDPVQVLVESVDQAQRAAAGVRRVLRVLDTPIDIPDPIDGVDLPPGPLGLMMENVSYRYPLGPVVLSEINVEIPPGRRVAIVGQTGSGKTTFAKLATRLIESDQGVVSIGGVHLPEVNLSSLRTRVAYVPQEGFLFNTTVAENIRYGSPAATDGEIASAVEQLGLSAWVGRLPDALQTRVGERGSNLSAGERQLVALIRAWISAPDLLVLDEATSAVDPYLEVSLRRAIELLTAGRTSITVAHRLSTAEASDEVLVFDGGRLVERGIHADLVARRGVYSQLYADWNRGVKSA
ncbi:MAG: ABC transporter ATP-binding protein [Acidimicrobiia bacterium]|nr:ABC transporter ATP-binding protein [Acidimicrobiia bacterium]MDQ3501039.1 ABC transporter ATP-binding protein/permease [Actinomycetota bacterium]